MTHRNISNKADLIASINEGWDSFQAYLNTLSMEQLTGPTDAAGWTAKDHVMHLAVWEDGMYALLQGESRPVYMGVDPQLWARGDYDEINAVLQQRYQDKSWPDVLRFFQAIHQRLMEKLDALSEEALMRPYNTYQPDSPITDPVYTRVIGNTFPHYAEHRDYIERIVNPE